MPRYQICLFFIPLFVGLLTKSFIGHLLYLDDSIFLNSPDFNHLFKSATEFIKNRNLNYAIKNNLSLVVSGIWAAFLSVFGTSPKGLLWMNLFLWTLSYCGFFLILKNLALSKTKSLFALFLFSLSLSLASLSLLPLKTSLVQLFLIALLYAHTLQASKKHLILLYVFKAAIFFILCEIRSQLLILLPILFLQDFKKSKRILNYGWNLTVT